MIAESLSEEEIAGLREMFTAMDTDNSGAITFDELKAGLRRYGSTLKDTEIRDLMEAVTFACLVGNLHFFCTSIFMIFTVTDYIDIVNFFPSIFIGFRCATSLLPCVI